MVKPPCAHSGYSLTEMMLVVAIIGILSTVGARVMLQVNRYFLMTNTRTDLQREARSVMYIINRNLRQAQSSSIMIDTVPGQPFYSRLTFTKIQGTTMTFYLSGMNLIQVVGTKNRILTKNIKHLAFTFPRSDDLSIVSVSVTLEKVLYQGRTQTLHMTSEKVRIMN